MGIPNFLTILSTLYKNCFQQAGVPFTMNENALSLAINLSIVPLRLFLAMPSVSAPALVLCIAKFIDELSGAPHIQTGQIICNLHLMEVLIKVQ